MTPARPTPSGKRSAMGERTEIGWTDHTFNPWWGCARVSPACNHCYAEAFAKRTGHAVWGKGGDRRFFGDKHWGSPRKWDRAAETAGHPALVFCASMADVFEDRSDLDGHRDRLFTLIGETPHLIWLLLTKRPENVMDMVPAGWHGSGYADRPERLWPSNVWVGTTVEDQKRADERLPTLATIPAPVRFLSCEPLLGPVDLINHIESVDWLIVGGESGAGHRPMDMQHARDLRQQAVLWDVPFFFKQIGGRTPKAGGDLLDGAAHKAWPMAAGCRA